MGWYDGDVADLFGGSFDLLLRYGPEWVLLFWMGLVWVGFNG